MFSDLFIGIDIGSSSLKALAIDGATGQVAAIARQALPYQRLPGGGRELGAGAIGATPAQVLRGLAQPPGVRWPANPWAESMPGADRPCSAR